MQGSFFAGITARRRVIYLSTVMLFILETLKHFSESPVYSISMWVMEFLVLALIAYEVGINVLHDRKREKRIAGIFGLVSDGCALQRGAPCGNADKSEIEQWISSVNVWIAETANLLKEYSPQAEASFLLGVRHDASYPGIASGAQRVFGLLIARLDNLQGIMEKPGVYF